MADIDNVKIGVCSVSFNAVDLGHTMEGVVVNYEPEYHDILVDRFGNTVAEKVLIGEKLTAVVTLAEATIANLRVAIPTGSTSPATRMTIGRDTGLRMTSKAAQLVLHPIANAAGVRTEDVVFHKAVASEPIELPHKFDEERKFQVTFTALLDESKSSGNYLGHIGDSAA